ncbi:hypothetical protein SEUBUCD650_0C00160 [Saccharomyces eubayanus]|uniref:DNA replication checkpoint mediator MRC1 domain-containing protein n=1 Tax=Saccharomyces eubayanus TaxID=1080349 RepID=A0ABN8VM09_SACEU|nr:hypothetical protein SEUBUCD650_0C00160 [Saccharomyces eubayanus]
MDDALNALSSLTSKKRATTYKKVASPIPGENDDTDGNLPIHEMDAPPVLMGNGFLFGNATLNRVKNRLEGKSDIRQDGHDKKNEDKNILSTQLIANLYDGGEELEKTKNNENKNDQRVNVTSFTQTQRIPVSITQQNNEVNVPIHSINDGEPTQRVKSIITTSQTQAIPFTTAEITQKATQFIDNHGVTSQTQQVPPTKLIEAQTQAGAATANDSDIQPQKFPIVATRTSPLFQTAPDQGPSTQMDTPPPTVHVDITQMDTMSQTMQDKVPPELKIHELQSELASEDSRRKTAHNIEYRKLQKTIPIVKSFSKESFLADFDNSSSDDDTNVKLESLQPKKEQNGYEMIDIDQSEPQLVQKENKKDMKVPLLSTYANNLKREIDSSKYITLDLDSGSENDNDDHMDAGKLIEDESALPISQLSKATIFNLKARLSKQNQKLAQGSNKNKGFKTDNNKLFNTLRKASRKQILDHQREIVETKGFKLEDMVKEKEIVENLLEQEILRNKKIRQKEKKKEQSEKNNFELNSHDSGSDSGSESSKFALSDNEIADYELSGSENEKSEDADDGEEEDDNITNKKKLYRTKHILNESDSEVEDEQKMEVEKKAEDIPKRNAIDLGHYGNNIDEDGSSSFRAAIVLDTQQVDEIITQTKSPKHEDNEGKEEKEEESEETGDDDDDDDDDDDVSEAIRRELIDKEKLERRQKEKEQATKLKELKSKGVTNFFEMEAEESEDEWHGVGGADGEGSDEYDSDVEKMIDDYSKNKFNSHEIREMLAAENKEMDVKMINKILYDIKNGGFRNKRAKNSLELELSDDEDDVLQQYRLKRRELMRKRRLEIGDDTKLVKNPKSKAFFESMVEDIMEFKNPFGAEKESDQDVTSTATDSNTQDNDSTKSDNSTSNNEHNKHAGDKSKKLIISEDFVQKSLSFLKSNNYDEFEMDNELARIQHGNGEGDVADLFTLKQHSLIKSFTNSQTDSFSSRTTNTVINLETHREGNDDGGNGDQSLVGGFKHPSVIKSFASRTDINDKFKEGNKTVKISKSYKTVGSSKASITYMGKTRKLMAPKRKIEEDHHLHHTKKLKTQKSKIFENGQDSFDS